MRKKGVSLSMEFIIIAALALLALIVIALFFTGGAEKLFGKQKGAIGVTIDPGIKSLAVESCKLSCTLGKKDAYDNPSFPKEVSANFADCAALLQSVESGDQSFATRCGHCEVKTDSEGIPVAVHGDCPSKVSKSDCHATTGCVWVS